MTAPRKIPTAIAEQASLEASLRRAVRGEVRLDAVSRGLYATDASIYQQAPLAVVIPRDVADVRGALAVAREHRLPVLPRGAGTSLAGQATAGAIVIDVSKHVNRLLETNAEDRWVRVEPGLVRDELNAALAPTGLHFAPETATSNRACIGGMIGNNSAGTRSIRYGQTRDHVRALSVLLPTGETLELERLDRDGWAQKAARDDREGALYRGVQAIVERHWPLIERRYPKVMRRVGGYRLDAFAPGTDWSLVDLVCGSEGTLCTVTEARLALEPLPGGRALCVAHFDEPSAALRAVPRIVEQGPAAVEHLDRTVLRLARETFGSRWRYAWLEGDPAAVLIVELLGDSDVEARAERDALIGRMRAKGIGSSWTLVEGADQQEVWEVRKAGLGLLLGMRSEAKPLPFIEDAAVPLDKLVDYIGDVTALCRSEQVELAMYAHASVGLLHVRPILDLKRADDIERMKRISQGALELVNRYGGSFSGEHGDGRVRSYALASQYGPELCEAFAQVKRLFDPAGLMNPNKIVDPLPIDRDLRLGPDYQVPPRETFFHFRDDGGLGASVELCSGVGACRKTGGGTMCPSYMATRDEADSTRGRANALRLAISGQLGSDGIASAELREVFELCLACKACKSECPSSVDVARMKAEVLAAAHAREGASLGDRFFAMAPRAAALLSGPWAAAVNRIAGLPPLRTAMQRVLGLDARRPLPPFASQSLARWFRGRRGGGAATGAGAEAVAGAGAGAGAEREVALFADTFTNYHEPNVGKAAVEVLEALGYRVRLLDGLCCGRTQISKGFLARARAEAARTLPRLAELAQRGTPVLVCEPGCYSALVDDLPDLHPDAALARKAAGGVQMIDVFLGRELASGALRAPGVGPGARRAKGPPYLVHGHCHQKAMAGTEATLALLRELSHCEVREVDSGCCGMAGSFGYERAHYELSLAIGEDRLFPAIRRAAPGTRVVASGFSCRHQIADALGVRAVHVVEEIARLLR